MVAAIPTPAQKVILHGVSWETYERLLNEHNECSGTHFFYNDGDLEILVLSYEHEKITEMLVLLINAVTEEWGIDIEGAGSTTFQRKDLAKGFEPDACYYIRDPERVRGKKRLDLRKDPPLDLVIEIDITNPSLDKLPIYAAVGVIEVWRYDGEVFTIHRLKGHKYVKAKESSLLQGVTGKDLLRFIAESQSLKRTDWLRRVRQWAQNLRQKNHERR
jgi:Uma2 family endonuclease